MSMFTEEIQTIIDDLAALFDAESMDEMDAADFTDKAGKTWNLVERARKFARLK